MIPHAIARAVTLATEGAKKWDLPVVFDAQVTTQRDLVDKLPATSFTRLSNILLPFIAMFSLVAVEVVLGAERQATDVTQFGRNTKYHSLFLSRQV